MGFTLTLSDMDADLLRELRSEAVQRSLPVETIAVEWMRRGCYKSLHDPRPLTQAEREQFMKPAGTWSAEEAAEFNAIVADFDKIDEEMWK